MVIPGYDGQMGQSLSRNVTSLTKVAAYGEIAASIMT